MPRQHNILTLKNSKYSYERNRSQDSRSKQNKVEEKLASLGAKKIFDGNMQTLFFDFKEGTIVKQKNVLRLRKDQEKIELTYKKVHVTQQPKPLKRYSVEVSNLETMKIILENLGLSVIDRMQKHRVSYTLDGARFDFDCYSDVYGYIPEFLEIEAESIDLVYKYAELLGFKEKDCLPWSTTDLIKHYSLKKLTSKESYCRKKIWVWRLFVCWARFSNFWCCFWLWLRFWWHLL